MAVATLFLNITKMQLIPWDSSCDNSPFIFINRPYKFTQGWNLWSNYPSLTTYCTLAEQQRLYRSSDSCVQHNLFQQKCLCYALLTCLHLTGSSLNAGCCETGNAAANIRLKGTLAAYIIHSGLKEGTDIAHLRISATTWVQKFQP